MYILLSSSCPNGEIWLDLFPPILTLPIYTLEQRKPRTPSFSLNSPIMIDFHGSIKNPVVAFSFSPNSIIIAPSKDKTTRESPPPRDTQEQRRERGESPS
jgi:hypothetical protein